MAKQTWLVLSWGWNRLFFLPNTFRHRTPIIKNIVDLKADVLHHTGKIQLEKSSLLLSQKRYYWQKIPWYFLCRQYRLLSKAKLILWYTHCTCLLILRHYQNRAGLAGIFSRWHICVWNTYIWVTEKYLLDGEILRWLSWAVADVRNPWEVSPRTGWQPLPGTCCR